MRRTILKCKDKESGAHWHERNDDDVDAAPAHPDRTCARGARHKKTEYARTSSARALQNKSLETLSDHYFTVISYRTPPHRGKCHVRGRLACTPSQRSIRMRTGIYCSALTAPDGPASSSCSTLWSAASAASSTSAAVACALHAASRASPAAVYSS